MAKKILIVDDDDDFTEAIKRLLESKSYEVLSASNGNDGFDLAKRENPDLILLDVMMDTDTEGFDVARRLHKDSATSSIPVILVTGIRREMNLSFGFEPDDALLPVRRVLEKPLKPEVLLKVIAENLA